MVIFGSQSTPLEVLEDSLWGAVGQFQARGWLIPLWLIESTLGQLRDFWHRLDHFAEYVEREQGERRPDGEGLSHRTSARGGGRVSRP
jgi:hypothetical protein